MLLGMQLPNLADQYTKRVDASLREATLSLQPFLIIANQYAQGDIEALIALHRKSTEAVFRAEADAIERIYRRKLYLDAQAKAMQTHVVGRLWHLLWRADADLREQTLLQYNATVPLTQEALIAGGVAALLMLLLLEGGMALGRRLNSALTRWFNHRWRGA
jgi:sensor c-di-GMP phosphodiesterase-like protein